MVNAYEPTATTLAIRVDELSSICLVNTSASGSDFMFSWPPRQEAHGQAALNNPNGYTLMCPLSHVMVNSRLPLLAVIPVGFSFILFPYLRSSYSEGARLRPKSLFAQDDIQCDFMVAAQQPKTLRLPSLREYRRRELRRTTRYIHPQFVDHP